MIIAFRRLPILRRTLVLLAMWAAWTSSIGCGSSPTAPTPDPVTETLGGTLASTNGNFHTFTASRGGTISLTLTSLTPEPITVGVGLGVVAANSCSLQFTNETFRVGTVWVNSVGGAGTYCIAVYDIGQVMQPVTYTLTLVHP